MATAEKKTPAEGEGGGFPILRVSILFSLLVLGFNLLQWLVLTPRYMEALQVATARSAAWLIGITGLRSTLNHTEIFLENAHWDVTPECTAISAAFVFLSFVLVFPASVRAKGIAVLAGLPFLFAANLARLLALAWVSKLSPGGAAFFHDYVWQVAFLFLVVLMWLLWIEVFVKHES